MSQALMVMLLGLQSLNVNGRHYLLAAITSLMLGVFGYYITVVIAAASTTGFGTAIWWSFIAAGPVGIVCSIWLHPKLVWLFNQMGDR